MTRNKGQLNLVNTAKSWLERSQNRSWGPKKIKDDVDREIFSWQRAGNLTEWQPKIMKRHTFSNINSHNIQQRKKQLYMRQEGGGYWLPSFTLLNAEEEENIFQNMGFK